MTQTDSGPAVTRLVAGAELPAPGRWQIDPGHTELAFIGRHFMLTKVRGRFTGLSGVIEVAERPGESTVAVTVDMASVESGNQARDDHLRSADFLDVANHPAGAFTGRVPDWQGTRGVLAGELTLRGVTRPVTLEAEYLGYAADPWGRSPGRLHRRGHHRPGRLGPDLEPAAGRRRSRRLEGDPASRSSSKRSSSPECRQAGRYDRRMSRPLTPASIPALLRQGAVTVAAGRVALGLTALAWPAVPARPWVGASADDLAATVFGRALGARDLALGLGALAALRCPGAEPGSAAAWVAAGALSDALDVAASLASWRDLPRITRWLVAASAGGAALTGAAAALTSVASRAPEASA